MEGSGQTRGLRRRHALTPSHPKNRSHGGVELPGADGEGVAVCVDIVEPRNCLPVSVVVVAGFHDRPNVTFRATLDLSIAEEVAASRNLNAPD